MAASSTNRGFDRRQILALIDGDAIEVEQRHIDASRFPLLPAQSLDRAPSQREFRKIAVCQVRPSSRSDACGGIERRRCGRCPQEARAAFAVSFVGRAGALSGKPPDAHGQRVAHQVRVDFVVERHLAAGPSSRCRANGSQVVRERCRDSCSADRRVHAYEVPGSDSESHHMEILMRGAVAVEVVPGEGGEIARVGHVQHALRAVASAAFHSAVVFTGAGMPFQNP